MCGYYALKLWVGICVHYFFKSLPGWIEPTTPSLICFCLRVSRYVMKRQNRLEESRRGAWDRIHVYTYIYIYIYIYIYNTAKNPAPNLKP